MTTPNPESGQPEAVQPDIGLTPAGETGMPQATAEQPMPASVAPTQPVPPLAPGAAVPGAPAAATGDGGWGGGPSGYPPSPYPAAAAPYPPSYGPTPPRTDDKAVWSLVSAIAGFVLCPLVLHVVGLVLANQSLRDIRSSGGRLGGEGLASTARILSIVGLVLYGAALVLGLLFLLIAVPLGLITFGTVAGQVQTEQLTVAPTSISEIDGQRFQHDAGDITYDLSDLDFTDRTVQTSIDVGAGSLLVEVPEDVTVVLDAQLGGGELTVFGDQTDGVGIDRDQTFSGTPSGGTLELEVDMGVGEVTVDRAG
jgi:uncharacterized membrane protein YphA (DoxX/SURF4 family)